MEIEQIKTTEINSTAALSLNSGDWRNPFLVKEGGTWKVMNSFFGKVILNNVEAELGDEPRSCSWNNYGCMAISPTIPIPSSLPHTAKVLFTVNYGQTWKLIEIPRVQTSYSGPMVFSHDGRIIIKMGTNQNTEAIPWYSNDYGNTFTRMPSNLFHQGTWGSATASMNHNGKFSVVACRANEAVTSSDYLMSLRNSSGYETSNQAVSKTVPDVYPWDYGYVSTTVSVGAEITNVFVDGVGKKRFTGIHLLPIAENALLGFKPSGEILLYKDYNDTAPLSVSATDPSPYYLSNRFHYEFTKAQYRAEDGSQAYRIWIYNYEGTDKREIEFDVRVNTNSDYPNLKISNIRHNLENTSSEPTYRMLVDKGRLMGTVQNSNYQGKLDVTFSSIKDSRVETRVCRFGDSTSSPLRLYYRDNYGLGYEQYINLPAGNSYLFPMHQYF